MKVVSGLELSDNFISLPKSKICIQLCEVLCTCELSQGEVYRWEGMILALNVLVELIVKSTHTLTLPFGLWVTTIGAHQSVGWSTGYITPLFIILVISFMVSSYSGMGTFLGTISAKGFVSSFNLMVYSSFIIPSPVNSFG